MALRATYFLSVIYGDPVQIKYRDTIISFYFVISLSHTDRKIVIFRTRKILILCTGKLLNRPLR